MTTTELIKEIFLRGLDQVGDYDNWDDFEEIHYKEDIIPLIRGAKEYVIYALNTSIVEELSNIEEKETRQVNKRCTNCGDKLPKVIKFYCANCGAALSSKRRGDIE